MADVVGELQRLMAMLPPRRVRRQCIVTPSMLALEGAVLQETGKPLGAVAAGAVPALDGIEIFLDDRFERPTVLDYETYVQLRRSRGSTATAGVPGECRSDPAGGTVGDRGDDP